MSQTNEWSFTKKIVGVKMVRGVNRCLKSIKLESIKVYDGKSNEKRFCYTL